MTWKIFIVTHGPIIDDYYKNDPFFSRNNYSFINVSDIQINSEKFDVINKNDLKNFIHIGRWYAEGEAIYNVFKLNIYEDYDYIGFIHWDYELLSENAYFGHRITSTIQKLIETKEKFVSFSTYPFLEDYNQRIMMDMNFPNQLIGNGLNCWETIVLDYNNYFGTSIGIDYLMTKRINLCSAFICQKVVFEDMMRFCSWVIESKKLEVYDLNHEHRFQGGMLERYIGCFSHQFSLADVPLCHRWSGALVTKSISRLEKIINFLRCDK